MVFGFLFILGRMSMPAADSRSEIFASAFSPSPLAGGGGGGGGGGATAGAVLGEPTPDPSPQGGGEQKGGAQLPRILHAPPRPGKVGHLPSGAGRKSDE